MWANIIAGWLIFSLAFLAFLCRMRVALATAFIALMLLLVVGCGSQPYVHISAEYPLNNGVKRYVAGEHIQNPTLGVLEVGAIYSVTESISVDCAAGHRSMLTTMKDRGEEYAKCGAVWFFGR